MKKSRPMEVKCPEHSWAQVRAVSVDGLDVLVFLRCGCVLHRTIEKIISP